MVLPLERVGTYVSGVQLEGGHQSVELVCRIVREGRLKAVLRGASRQI